MLQVASPFSAVGEKTENQGWRGPLPTDRNDRSALCLCWSTRHAMMGCRSQLAGDGVGVCDGAFRGQARSYGDAAGGGCRGQLAGVVWGFAAVRFAGKPAPTGGAGGGVGASLQEDMGHDCFAIAAAAPRFFAKLPV